MTEVPVWRDERSRVLDAGAEMAERRMLVQDATAEATSAKAVIVQVVPPEASESEAPPVTDASAAAEVTATAEAEVAARASEEAMVELETETGVAAGVVETTVLTAAVLDTWAMVEFAATAEVAIIVARVVGVETAATLPAAVVATAPPPTQLQALEMCFGL